MINLLGFNTSTKLLTNPYPLGGYDGVEIGLSYQIIDIDGLSRLGCTPGSSGCPNTEIAQESEFHYAELSLGKGLFNDIDVFFHFLPPMPGTHITNFGGVFRWSFLQGHEVPVNLSLNGHVNRISIQDSLTCLVYGADVIAGLSINMFSLYFGAGYLMAQGQFTGGDTGAGVIDPSDPALNPNSNTIVQDQDIFHTVVGLTYHHSIYFIAGEIDRYQDPVYSFKLGLRF